MVNMAVSMITGHRDMKMTFLLDGYDRKNMDYICC